MIKISVKQTKAFNEMSDLECLEWFDVHDKAVLGRRGTEVDDDS